MSSNYFNARTNRFDAVSKNLIKIGFELIKDGYEVYVYEDSLTIESLYIFDKDQMCVVGFREVPYSWICNSNGYSNPSYGLVKNDSYAIPFDIDFIKHQFGPIRPSIHYKATKESYLKFHSWMIPIQTNFTNPNN